jgi:hypothetical protein
MKDPGRRHRLREETDDAKPADVVTVEQQRAKPSEGMSGTAGGFSEIQRNSGLLSALPDAGRHACLSVRKVLRQERVMGVEPTTSSLESSYSAN